MNRDNLIAEQAAPGRILPGSYVDLPAVFGGAVIAAALVGVFTTFGGALGLSAVSAVPGEGSLTFWGIITALWVVLTIIFSFATGGYVTGRLRRRLETASADEVSTRDGLNGLIVWGLGTLVAGWMVAGAIGGVASVAGNVAGTAVSAAGTAAGGVVSAAGSALGGTAQAVGAAVGGTAQALGAAAVSAGENTETEGVMGYITDTLLRPAMQGARSAADGGIATPQRPSMNDSELSRQVGVILANVMRTGEVTDDEKQFLVAATAQRTSMTEQEVVARVDTAVQKVQDTRAEAERLAAEAKAEAERIAAEAVAEAERLAEAAKQAAIDAAETARKSAILMAFLLTAAALAAAAASLIGSVVGGRHRDEGKVFGGFRYR